MTIQKIGFSLFNKMNVEGLYIEDQNKDTLLYAGLAKVNITDWFFLKDKAVLSYIGLNNFLINTYRKDNKWNYQFLIDQFASSDTITKKSNKSQIELSLQYINLKKGQIKQNDLWLGQNQIIQFESFEINAHQIDFAKKIVHLDKINIDQPFYKNEQFTGNKPIVLNNPSTYDETTQKTTKTWKLFGWDLLIDHVEISEGTLDNAKQTIRAPYRHFDGQHLYVTNINGTFNNIKWNTDTVTLQIKINAKERSGFKLDNLQAKIIAYPNTILFDDLIIRTPHSNIKDQLEFSFNDFNKDINDFINLIHIKASFNNTKVSPKDIAFFAPSIINTLKDDIYLKGQYFGTVNDFYIDKANIKMGNTVLNGNFSMNGLPNINNTIIEMKSGSIVTTYNDITKLAPQLKSINGVKLDQLGQIYFNGDFIGLFNDFKTKGVVRTNLGTVNSDIAMSFLPNQQPTYAGTINTPSFDIGKLINNKSLGRIGYNGNVKGVGFALDKMNANINGTTTQFTYNGYQYKNIITNGVFANKKYDGQILINDPNLSGSLNGIIDFSSQKPTFDLQATIKNSNFKNLRFTKENYSFSGNANLDFEGISLDDFDGIVSLENAKVTLDNEILPFHYFTLQSNQNNNGRTLQINSDEFDGYITGKYSLANVANAFKLFLHQYYPNVFEKPQKFDLNQRFEFELNTKSVNAYTKIIDKSLVGLNNAYLKGSINTFNNEAAFEASIPEFTYDKYVFTNLQLLGKGALDSLNIKATMNQVVVDNQLTLYNSSVNLNTINNQTSFNFQSSSNETFNAFDVKGNLLLFEDGVEVYFSPSSFTVNNKIWELENSGELIIRDNIVSAKNLKFSHNNQNIIISTEASDEGNETNIIADIENLEVNDFAPLVIKTNSFYGKLNGKVTVFNPNSNPYIETKSYIDNFVIDDKTIGRLDITGNFDIATNNVNYTAISKEIPYLFDIKGHYYPNDSLGLPIYNKIQLNGTNINLIEPYLSSVFKNVNGKAKGELEIVGNSKDQFITGSVNFEDSLSFLVKYTNVQYRSYQPTFDFRIGEIEFSGIDVFDTLKNSAHVKKGKITHRGFFEDMGLDINFYTQKMLLLNTTRVDNSTFFGKAIADAEVKLKGNIDNELKMSVKVDNPQAATIFLNTSSSSKTLGKADFIEFKEYGIQQGFSKPKINNRFILDMSINANQNAEVNVILDELAGDRIRALGNGNIKIGIAESDLTLNGNYVVENGDYTFSLQSWFRKPFTIKKGSTINWSGNPYDAEIKINANYIAKDVDLKARFTDISSNSATVSPLEVVANLSGKLSKPDIGFEIKYPDVVSSKDPQIESYLKLMQQDQTELNKQVAFLVLFDRLLPETNFNIESAAFNTVSNTISGLITSAANNAINGLLFKRFGNKLKANIDFRTYSPGSLEANQNISQGNSIIPERAVSSFGINRSLFNDRLVLYISGNLDFGLVSSSSNQTSFALLPNLLLEYKILPNGSVVGTIFHRQTIDAITTDPSQNRRISTGGGIGWRRESDDFWDALGLRKRKKLAKPNL